MDAVVRRLRARMGGSCAPSIVQERVGYHGHQHQEARKVVYHDSF
jgi:hypothetical protein